MAIHSRSRRWSPPLFGLLAVLSLAPQLRSQSVNSAPAPAGETENTIVLEAFNVTGSNLRRIDQENALPVTVLDQEIFLTRDASTPVQLLTALPQVVNVPLNEAALGSATARGDNAAVNMRGLGTGNTLVLLNGRRVVAHGISSDEGSLPSMSVNVNQLPARGMDRVEVLRDGASAIYGTDAVAGVINYIMRKDFRGLEFHARYGFTEEGGAEEKRATLMFGAELANRRARWVGTVDFYHRSALNLRDRDYSSDGDYSRRAPAPWNDVNQDADFFQRSGRSEFGTFIIGTPNANGTFTGARPAGVPATIAANNGRVYVVPTGNGGVGFTPTTPLRTGVQRDYYSNQSAYQMILPKTDRVNVFNQFEFDLTPQVVLFGELGVYRANSRAEKEPSGISVASDGIVVVPTNNPWNPFGTRYWDPAGAPNADGSARLTGTPSAVQLESYTFSHMTMRYDVIDSDVYRMLGGVRGKFAERWNWESAALYSSSKAVDTEFGNMRESRFKSALNRTDRATALNPFGYEFGVQGGALVVRQPYRNSDAVLNEFLEPVTRTGKTELSTFDFRTSGELFNLWGNPLSVAVGAEYRWENYDDVRAPFAGFNPPGSGLPTDNNDFLQINPAVDVHGDRNVTSLYAEAVLPLVSAKNAFPLFASLELNASARHENYSDFGGTTKPKFGVNWRPVRQVLLRASYNEGFRAPNLAQLYTGALIRSVTSIDQYRSPVTGLPGDGNVNRPTSFSGNRDLKPEEAKGRSAGMVVEVPLIKGLSLSADYWRIEQDNVVASSDSLGDDFDALIAATQRALSGGTPIGSVNLGSGTASYQGDAKTVRAPVTADDLARFAAYNATRAPADQRAPVGPIVSRRDFYINRATTFTSGLDFGANWRSRELGFGRISASTEWSYLIDYYAYDRATAPKEDRVEKNGNARWRGNVSLVWRNQAWTAGLSGYYIGDYGQSGAETTATVYNALGRPGYIKEVLDLGVMRYRYVVEDTWSYNAFASYDLGQRRNDWLAHTSVRLGVVNLTDKPAPLGSGGKGFDTAVYTHLFAGRTWSIEVTKRF